LEFNREALANAAPTDNEEGIEEAFELVCEINEKVRTAKWIGDCFVYTTHSGNKLNYLIGGKVSTVVHGDK
jgi:coatomer subunit beta'